MFRSNRVIRFLLVVIFIMHFPTLSFANALTQDQVIVVSIDGKPLSSDVPPTMVDNRVYVPLRAIFEAHGAVVTWYEESRLVVAIIGNQTISYPIDGITMIVNGKSINLELKPIVVNNRTLIPVRAISESLGSDVKWDNVRMTVTVTTKAFKITSSMNTPSAIKLALRADARSKNAGDKYAQFVLDVQYYGVKENRFYTLLHLSNNRDKDIRISLDPGAQQILALINKNIDPMPDMNYEDCSRVRATSINDGLGHINQIPEFYTDSACVSRNEAKKAEIEEWRKNNWGVSVVGSGTVSIRKEIQSADGSLNDYVIPAKGWAGFIITSELPNESKLSLVGNYYIEGSPDKVAPIELEYAISNDMGLGDYDVFFTSSMFKYSPQ